jgi:hypothetical protein
MARLQAGQRIRGGPAKPEAGDGRIIAAQQHQQPHLHSTFLPAGDASWAGGEE